MADLVRDTVPTVGVSLNALARLQRAERRNRKRARDKGAQAEPVNIIAVLNGQGWLCVICNAGMDPELDGCDPDGITIEHSPALGCGGHHKAGQVFGAHRACNTQKGRKTDTSKAAKIKRQAGMTGQSARRERAKAAGTYRGIPSPKDGMGKGRGFDKTFTKRFDGSVVRRDGA